MEDEECLDDPIRLYEFELNRVCFTKFTNHFEVNKKKYFTKLNDDEIKCQEPVSSYGKEPSMLPVTFLNIERNLRLLSRCRPLCVKIVDCEKYPDFYKKRELKSYANTQEIQIGYDTNDIILIDVEDEGTVENHEKNNSNRNFNNSIHNFEIHESVQFRSDNIKNTILNEAPKKYNSYTNQQSDGNYHDMITETIDKDSQKKDKEISLTKSTYSYYEEKYGTNKLPKETSFIDNMENIESKVILAKMPSASTNKAETITHSCNLLHSKNITPDKYDFILETDSHVDKYNNQRERNSFENKKNLIALILCRPFQKSANRKPHITQATTQQKNNFNITSENIPSGNISSGNISDGNISSGNISSGNISSGNIFWERRIIPHYHERILNTDKGYTSLSSLQSEEKHKYATFTHHNPSKTQIISIPTNNNYHYKKNDSNNCNGRYMHNSLQECSNRTCIFSSSIPYGYPKDDKFQHNIKNIAENTKNRQYLTKKPTSLEERRSSLQNQTQHQGNNANYFPTQPVFHQPQNFNFSPIHRNDSKTSGEGKARKYISPNLNNSISRTNYKGQRHPHKSCMSKVQVKNSSLVPNMKKKIAEKLSKAIAQGNFYYKSRVPNKNLNCTSNANREIICKSIDSKNEDFPRKYPHIVEIRSLNAHSINERNGFNQISINQESINPNNSRKGYSPPILPIPSYQKTFEEISKIQHSYIPELKMFEDPEKAATNVNIQNKRSIPKKITFSEYKARYLTKSDNNVKNQYNQMDNDEIIKID